MGVSSTSEQADEADDDTGSCAFLIGSVAQMYEAVWREPEAEDL